MSEHMNLLTRPQLSFAGAVSLSLSGYHATFIQEIPKGINQFRSTAPSAYAVFAPFAAFAAYAVLNPGLLQQPVDIFIGKLIARAHPSQGCIPGGTLSMAKSKL